MDLIKDIHNSIDEKQKLWEEQAAEILAFFEEENEKPSIGINETFGERASAARAGEQDWVRGMARDQQDPLKEPVNKPIFLMGKQIPPRACKFTADGRCIVRAKGRTFEYEVDDQGDKIVLR